MDRIALSENVSARSPLKTATVCVLVVYVRDLASSEDPCPTTGHSWLGTWTLVRMKVSAFESLVTWIPSFDISCELNKTHIIVNPLPTHTPYPYNFYHKPRSLDLVIQSPLGLERNELLERLLQRHNITTLLRSRIITIPHVQRTVLLLLGTKNWNAPLAIVTHP